ncbi:hypothetical protein SVAN01_09945 [Stagonosporopsis vannaccii]|nr:hypothetical protein SVAN01_09945 [Stagonosporopsis vannaccii]
MASANASCAEHEDPKLPAWLANHFNIEWSSDDVDALLDSINASQSPRPPALPHLPAELLVLILEYVPIAYVLDWRLVCRGFRDAIDGPVLYHHLQRAQLLGYLGPRTSTIMDRLTDEEYEDLHLVTAPFDSLPPDGPNLNPGPLWRRSHAVFSMDAQWCERHRSWDTPDNGLPSVNSLLSQLELHRSRQGFGTLIWALKLDTAVLDLDLPLEPERRTFDVNVDLESATAMATVTVEWRPMLFRFIKTETALRHLMAAKRDSSVTFSHAEDCLRAVRRQRLHAALDPDNKIDRHLKWSLRLLRPLWHVTGHRDPSLLDVVEGDAVGTLLLLRRTALLSKQQIKHLHHLAVEYARMTRVLSELSHSLRTLKAHLILPGHDDTLYFDTPEVQLEARRLPLNPVAWSDEQRVSVEARVQRWKAQERLVTQMRALMVASQEARSVPEDAFDAMDSDF